MKRKETTKMRGLLDAIIFLAICISLLVLTSNVFGQTNVALNKTATVSSVENSSYPAGNVTDGSTSSRWASQQGSENEWIYIDLGSANNINRVVLKWEAAYGKSYKIQTSNDLSAWTDIFSTTSGDGGTDDLTVTGSGRYIRMAASLRGTAWGYSLWEFEVYGSAVTTITKYESENATRNGGGIATDHTGYSGTGFWAFVNTVGNSIQYNITNATAGSQNILCRYACSGNQKLSLYVNGTKIRQVSFTPTANWDTWADKTDNVTLLAGSNTIKYQYDSGDNGRVNIDYISVGSSSTTDLIPPSVPTVLNTSNITKTGFTLSWTASTDNVGVTAYEVYSANTLIGTTAATSLNVQGLTCATTYTMTVKAKDAAGNISTASAPINQTTSACDEVTCGSVINPGFENDLNNWGSTGNTTITTVAKSGNKAAVSGTAEGGLNYSNQILATGGQTITFKAWAKVENGPSWAGFGIDYLNASDVEIGEIVLTVNATTYT